MKIYLIRHGQSTSDIENRYGGSYDDDLTDVGRQQAAACANELSQCGIEKLYSSPFKRARQTAEIIGEKLGQDIINVPDMRERDNYGVLTGMRKDEARERYAAQVENLESRSPNHSVQGSEDYKSFVKRITDVFMALLRTPDQTIAVVTHGGPIEAIAREILKIGEFKELSDCAIIGVQKREGYCELDGLTRAELARKG
ncbi:MAG: histidine phosphatase family protein [Nanoarchaeota archaeon]